MTNATNDCYIARLEGMITALDNLVMNVETVRAEMQAEGTSGASGVRAGVSELMTARRTLAKVVAEMVLEGQV
jgi:hypothetical protein